MEDLQKVDNFSVTSPFYKVNHNGYLNSLSEWIIGISDIEYQYRAKTDFLLSEKF